jgi:hypothetical protein
MNKEKLGVIYIISRIVFFYYNMIFPELNKIILFGIKYGWER